MNAGRILVVDDDWLNIEVMKAYLEMGDFAVTAVLSGEEAIKTAKADAPDLIFMDVRMSGMDGYETTTALKADATTQHIPVVIVTAFDAQQDIERAVAAGADDMLFKPINGTLMLLRAKTLIRMKRLYDQLNA